MPTFTRSPRETQINQNTVESYHAAEAAHGAWHSRSWRTPLCLLRALVDPLRDAAGALPGDSSREAGRYLGGGAEKHSMVVSMRKWDSEA